MMNFVLVLMMAVSVGLTLKAVTEIEWRGVAYVVFNAACSVVAIWCGTYLIATGYFS